MVELIEQELVVGYLAQSVRIVGFSLLLNPNSR